MNKLIPFAIEGHVAVITMTNPPANTWTRQSLDALAQLIQAFNADKNIYSLVITGDGEKFFSAGADLKLFADGNKQTAADLSTAFGRAFEVLSQFRGLSIAAINGYAMGGGLEVALACDLRIAEGQAQMAMPEAAVGLLPCAGGTQNLAWLVGEGWAKRMILCGERVSAQQALTIGLVEAVVEQGQALEKAMEWARNSERQSPTSIAACKRLIQSARKEPMFAGMGYERDEFINLFNTNDQKEGVQAFLEKRKPKWTNS
ncbi:enoyl-CoA hydratase [Oceanospirillaceae bacterium]|uniref:enoyl-CoA hydratase n=1 Tax=Candidatus Njordibacter sp. Uisw_002 TaxID=3230971 RepID=UPI0023352B54|nr:enoyl-CoA hydratase [Oceanospirillaceae bacterium]